MNRATKTRLLALRLAARRLPMFRWMPGMRLLWRGAGYRVIVGGLGDWECVACAEVRTDDPEDRVSRGFGGALPDVMDPATWGCILSWSYINGRWQDSECRAVSVERELVRRSLPPEYQ
jgi:hypothetical protein